MDNISQTTRSVEEVKSSFWSFMCDDDSIEIVKMCLEVYRQRQQILR